MFIISGIKQKNLLSNEENSLIALWKDASKEAKVAAWAALLAEEEIIPCFTLSPELVQNNTSEQE